MPDQSPSEQRVQGAVRRMAANPPPNPRSRIPPPVTTAQDIVYKSHDTLKSKLVKLAMCCGYDTFRFTPVPDKVFKAVVEDFDNVAEMFRNKSTHHLANKVALSAYRGYFQHAVVRAVCASDALEDAGAGLHATRSLVGDVMDGKVMAGEIEEDDSRYNFIVEHLSQKKASTSHYAVQQSYRQVVQHVSALFFLLHHMIVRSSPLSSATIRRTHKILISGIGAHNEGRDPFTAHESVYRTIEVPRASGSYYSAPDRIRDQVSSTMIRINAAFTLAVSQNNLQVDPFHVATQFSHILVNIHPFLDGNRRLSRILLNAILMTFMGIMIPFGKDPIELAKWKELVESAEQMDVQYSSGGTVPWTEMVAMVLIQAAREMRDLSSRIAGYGGNVGEGVG